MNGSDDEDHYEVLANCEDVYTVWPVARGLAGWRSIGVKGTKKECLDHIRAVDNETRSSALRKRLERDLIMP
jgi:MbtH protein